MRAAGCDHGMLKRFVMCGRICDPIPRMKRPFETRFRSWLVFARIIGFRANATAIDVMSSTRSVCSAASARGRNGSFETSADTMPS